jgi:hypothetical protein
MIATAAWRRREACARDNERPNYNANREVVNTPLESSAIPLGRSRSISADVNACFVHAKFSCVLSHTARNA